MSLLSSSLLGRREGCGSEEACLNRDKSWAEACPTDRPDRGGKSVRIVLSQGGKSLVVCCTKKRDLKAQRVKETLHPVHDSGATSLALTELVFSRTCCKNIFFLWCLRLVPPRRRATSLEVVQPLPY